MIERQRRDLRAAKAVIDGRLHSFRITGTALSPEYVFAIAPGATIPDDARYGILWVNRDAAAAAYGMTGAFNDLAVTLTRAACGCCVPCETASHTTDTCVLPSAPRVAHEAAARESAGRV